MSSCPPTPPVVYCKDQLDTEALLVRGGSTFREFWLISESVLSLVYDAVEFRALSPRCVFLAKGRSVGNANKQLEEVRMS